jgi:hypothetical protein
MNLAAGPRASAADRAGRGTAGLAMVGGRSCGPHLEGGVALECSAYSAGPVEEPLAIWRASSQRKVESSVTSLIGEP